MRLDEINVEALPKSQTPSDSFNKFDGLWIGYVEACNALPAGINVEDACTAVGMSKPFMDNCVDASLGEWRNSPSGSMFHALTALRPGEAPKAGSPIFQNLMWQTRFILKAEDRRILPRFSSSPVRDKNGNRIVISNQAALVVAPESEFRVNRIIRALYLYWFLNSRKAVKLPKVLYPRAGSLQSSDFCARRGFHMGIGQNSRFETQRGD